MRNALDAVKEGGTVAIARATPAPSTSRSTSPTTGPASPTRNAPIFDAFYTTKDREPGLGLSIVQRIVTDHGGEVSFASRPGSTVFTVRLPAEPAQSVL